MNTPNPRGKTDPMEHWHLMYTNPRKERLVCNQLEDRGFEVFFPYVRIKRGYGRGVRLEPLFPHYLFFRASLASAEAADLRVLPGVRTIVHIDNFPVVVPDEVVVALQEKWQKMQGKVVSKAEWLFAPGQSVVVCDGPFKGYEAIFQKKLSGGRRVQLLLKLVETWTRAEISVLDIQPVKTN